LHSAPDAADATVLPVSDAALRASEIQYRRLFEAAKDGILMLDADTGEITAANPFLADLLGYEASEILGKKLWEISPFEDTTKSKILFKELQAEEYVRYDDLPLETRRGRLIDVEFVSNIYLSGDRRVIQCNIRDITAKKEADRRMATLQAQLHQAQKMEAIGRLAGGVAHDFNNLLTVMLGCCEMLLDGPRQVGEDRRDIEQIQKAALRAAALTGQLLALSRKQIIQPMVLDVASILDDIRPMLSRLIREDVAIVYGPCADLAPIKVDRTQFEQVVLNLVVNAQDAMPDGGTLTIDAANVDLEADLSTQHVTIAPGPYVVLSVTDSGTGMGPAVLERLFEPFFTTKVAGKGTGLGLATVHGIVARSGGGVSVTTALDQGSRFSVYFPRADAAAQVVDHQLPPDASLSGTEMVLVVEDADGLRELTQRLLERLGYAVLVAANAKDALDLFDAHPSIALVLTDVVMPGQSGPSLTRQLGERRPGLKCIYMSGYTDDAIVEHGVLQPGIAFLHKPFTANALARMLRQTLDQPTSTSCV